MCLWQTQNWTASTGLASSDWSVASGVTEASVGRAKHSAVTDHTDEAAVRSTGGSMCVCVFGLEFCREALEVQRKTWAGSMLSCRVANKTWDKVTWSKTHLMSVWFGEKWTKSRPKTGKELKTWTWFSKAGFTWQLLTPTSDLLPIFFFWFHLLLKVTRIWYLPLHLL